MHSPKLEAIRVEAVRSFEFWQRRLLSPDGLAKLAKNLGLGWFTEDDILGLWSIGLLRSDSMSTRTSIESPHFPLIDTTDGIHTYCDTRRLNHRSEGFGSSLGDPVATIGDRVLEFHPYRLYVLHHVRRTLVVKTSSTQFLRYEDGVLSVAQSELEALRRWTSSVEFGERFHYWNQICEIAAVAEPVSYDVLYSDCEPEDFAAQSCTSYECDLRDMLRELGKPAIRQMRSDLAFAAETLDDNRSVHVLLRLAKASERAKLNGHLGGAMHFLAMAESIRRGAERAFCEGQPEEDEIGPGQWFPDARKMLYGSERVFDAPKHHLRDYLSLLGLDFGVKVRCYVEGETEFGALSHAVGAMGHIQLVNLSGSVAERGRKGLAFAESLAADKNAGIFSVILLDGDREDYLRIVRNSAREECFFGSFFVSTPDFEFGNFSAEELINLAFDSVRTESDKSLLDERMRAVLAQAPQMKGNSDFWAVLKRHEITHVRKSEQWGKALMEHAIVQPCYPSHHPRAGQMRTIVEATKLLIRVRDVGFLRSISRERVNPETGRVVSRPIGGSKSE